MQAGFRDDAATVDSVPADDATTDAVGPAAGRSRTPRARKAVLDPVAAAAVDLARSVAEELSADTPTRDGVGAHLGVTVEGERLVAHEFECLLPGYVGWRWSVVLARSPRQKFATVVESALLPGPDALLAPEWVPWSERLRPGDLGPGDLLPTEADDLRLEAGWTGEPGEPEEAPDEAEGEAAGPEDEAAAEAVAEVAEEVIVSGPSLSTIGAVARQLGMGRPRVLSRYGLHTAADRWEEQFGPKTPMAQGAPANCASCGFLVPIAGSLSQAFGVCANEFSPADGHLVSLGYGCGAHSEAAVMPRTPRPAPMVLDELHDTEPLPLHPDRHASVEDGEPSEDDLGHG